MQLLSTLRNALRIPDLRKRILFTFWMLVVYRVGSRIPIPGIDKQAIAEFFGGGLFGFLDMFAGGALTNFTIFALNVTPYITASIVMQLLTLVIPKLEEWSQEGAEGRKRINSITRYLTVALALIQAFGMSFGIRSAIVDPTIGNITVIALTMTAGTAFLMWLGEQITEYGIGNGISLIIFAGIVSGLPMGLVNIVQLTLAGAVNIINVLMLLAIAVFVLIAIVWMQEGQRKVPVQYSKRVVGRKVYGGQSSHIPIKVNQAGVIPVIFASSVLLFPMTIAQFVQHPIAQAIANALDFQTTLYQVLYATFIIFFTYFYTAITWNPTDVANNMKKYGGFVPGIRPGRRTAQYLDRILTRLTLVGALFLAAVSVMPAFITQITDFPAGSLYFGGTGLLIVVGVALETMKQIESHLLMRHYKGFIK